MRAFTVGIALCVAIAFSHLRVEAATLLAGYDMDTNTGTSAGAAVSDISGAGVALDAVLQATATVIVDGTRPGASATNEVLSIGSGGLGAFSGYDARLDTGSDGFTFVAWVKHSNLANFQQVVGRGPFAERIFNDNGAYALAVSNSNLGGFQFIGATPNGNNDGQWHHVAVSLDLGNPADPRVKGYLDGVKTTDVATGMVSVDPRNNGIDMGGRQFDGLDQFPGALLDEVGYFRGALGDDDIAALFRGDATIADFSVIPEPTGLLIATTGVVAALAVRLRQSCPNRQKRGGRC